MNSSPKEQTTIAGERTQLTKNLNRILSTVEETHRRFGTNRHCPHLILEKGDEVGVCPLPYPPGPNGEKLTLRFITEMIMEGSPDKAYLVAIPADKLDGDELVICLRADKLGCEVVVGRIAHIRDFPPQITWVHVINEGVADHVCGAAVKAGFELASKRNGASLNSLAGLEIKAAGVSATCKVVQASEQ